MNKFDQLLNDLDSGELSTTHIQIALRSHFKNRKDIPDGVKSLICGTSDTSGLIFRFFKLMDNTIGSIELAYRRGEQVDKD